MGIFSKFEGKMEDTFEGAGGMRNAPISPVQIMKKAEKQMRREKMVSAGKQYAPTLYTVLVNPDDDQRLFGFYPTLAGECETRLAASAASDGLSMDGQPLVRFIVDEGLKHGKFDVIAEVVSAPIIEQLRAEEMQRYGMGGSNPAPAQADPYAQQPYGQQAYGAPAYGSGQPRVAQQQFGAPAQQSYGAAQAPYGAQPYGAPAANDPYHQGGAYPAQAGQGAYPAQAPQGAYPSGISVPPVFDAEPAAKPPLPYVPEEEIDRSVDYGEYTFNSKNFADYREEEHGAQQPERHEAGTFFDEEPLPGADGSAMQANEAGQADESGQQEASAAQASGAPQQDPYAQAAQQPAAYDQYGRPVQPQQMGAFPQAPAAGAYPAGMGAYPAAGAMANPAYGAAGAAAMQGVPHTVAFAAGAGQAAPVPNQAMVRAHLIDIASNRSYDLATNRVLLGRETGNDIVINDLNASRQHAQIEFEPQGIWVITDLGSTNGTLVNGMPVQRRGLTDGDRITLGVTEFVFTLR